MRRAQPTVDMTRELVRQAMEGDRAAFSELMRSSLARQHAIANLILRDRGRAEDAVQEAFVAAWRGLSALRNPDAWEAWLQRLTVRSCFHAVRREKRRRTVELHVVLDPEPAASQDSVMGVVHRDLLERELGRLPMEQRTVIVLRYYADLPLDQIADILGIPIGTAKSRQHRGLEAMRASLSDATPNRLSSTVEQAS